ncbi:MAG: 50S ribosome-binding GTPase [Phycisphaerales bacterium]|nr:50S ribosome-binding GTPase [Phycisphaerales bacterium]
MSTNPTAAPTGETKLATFLGRLLAAHTARPAEGRPLSNDPTITLRLAEAALRYADSPVPRPRQFAVLGPTQTGKSTLVNVLLGQGAAAVSPLAGFTIHAQGFWLDGEHDRNDTPAWITALFPGYTHGLPNTLTRTDLAAFSLARLPIVADGDTLFARTPLVPTPAVVWDTPDFDSLAARDYVRGVLETVALADHLVLVVSKEKYADLTVWQMLELLAPLGRPLTFILNKLSADGEGPIRAALERRLADRGTVWGVVPIIALPYEPGLAGGDGTTSHLMIAHESTRTTLRTALARAAPLPHLRRSGVARLLRTHWDTWLAPVRAEHEALGAWQDLVTAFASDFLRAYERDYLNHPERYDAFRRATVELLALLELPRIGGLMLRMRQAVTWPARQAYAWLRTSRPTAAGPHGAVHSLGAEAGVLIDTLDTLLLRLQRELLLRCQPGEPASAIWRALERTLENARGALLAQFSVAIRTHHEHVQAEVRAAAGRLFTELQKHPARLAALRTGRAAVDLGALLLAVKTGGLTPLDLIWAPATFALSSFLVEGSAGLQMQQEARAIRRRQRVAVENTLVAGVLVPLLADLTNQLAPEACCGINPDEVTAATTALAEWEETHA